MEIVYFTIIGAALYLGSDWVLNRIEEARGSRLPQRSLVFFAIIFCASMIAFSCMRQLSAPEGPPPTAREAQPAAPPAVTQK